MQIGGSGSDIAIRHVVTIGLEGGGGADRLSSLKGNETLVGRTVRDNGQRPRS